MIKVTDLRQDEVTKEANTVHIVSMNVAGGEVRVVELDSEKLCNKKTTNHLEVTTKEYGISLSITLPVLEKKLL